LGALDVREVGFLIVKKLEQQFYSDWNKYVRSAKHGLPTQFSLWEQILTESYGYPCYFLYAIQESAIRGVLPLYLVESSLTGRRLDSMPGALCADSNEVAQALVNEADALARELKVSYMLLRDSRQLWSETGLDAVVHHKGVSVSLPSDPDTMWKSLPRGVRYDIRNGRRKANLTIKIDRFGLKDFYDVLLWFSRDVGTPLFSYQFLSNVVEMLPKDYQIVLAYHNQKPLAGYFNFLFADKILGMWGCALHEFLDLKVTHQSFWAIIEKGIEDGFSTFDMGRSPFPSTQYDFKAKWGDSIYPIYQLFRIYTGKKPSLLTHAALDGPDIQLNIFRQVWRRLPLNLVGKLGPKIRWHIPFA